MKVFTLTVLFILLGGCSYGTYYATGSYADQDNSRHGCEKENK